MNIPHQIFWIPMESPPFSTTSGQLSLLDKIYQGSLRSLSLPLVLRLPGVLTTLLSVAFAAFPFSVPRFNIHRPQKRLLKRKKLLQEASTVAGFFRIILLILSFVSSVLQSDVTSVQRQQWALLGRCGSYLSSMPINDANKFIGIVYWHRCQ
jgi:hypothetical protein